MLYKAGSRAWVRRFVLTSFLAILATVYPPSETRAANVSLAWDASISTGIVGYNVYYGTATSNYTAIVPVTNATAATISGLTIGTTYYFAATAFDDTGLESDFSGEVSYTVPATGTTNTPPTLAAIGNLTISEDAGLQTVSLAGISSGSITETQALTVTAVSSNPSLIPNPTVSYSSPNATGSLTFRPVANANGSATLTVTVNDGQAQNSTSSRTFTVSVTAVNDPPVISAIADRATTTGTALAPISFTVGDVETSAANLIVSGSSSNPALLPNANLIFGGSGANRTVTLAPLANQVGDADVVISVSDGAAATSTFFHLSVTASRPLNTPPTISFIGNQSIAHDTSAGPISFTVGDAETAAANLAVTAVSSNPTLIPNGNIILGGSGGARTVTLTPASKQSGSANITITVSDGTDARSSVFVLNVTGSFVAANGSYNGLFYESEQVNQSSAGSFTVRTTTRGTYSGRLQLGAQRLSFTGQLDAMGFATNHLKRSIGSPLTLEMTFDMNDQVSGRVTDGAWIASLSGDRLVFNAHTNPASYAGTYTMIIPGREGDPVVPQGDGFSTARVTTSGYAYLVATLADGTRVSQSAPLSKHGAWPVYVALYRGQGSLMSWLAFNNLVDTDLAGGLSWIKLASASPRYYPAGFSAEYNAVGSAYHRPASTTTHILNLDHASVDFTGGNLSADFANQIALGISSRVSNLSSNRFSLSFSLATGTFRGSVIDPSTGKSKAFGGAVLQKLNVGCGSLLGTNASSRVFLSP